MMTQTYTAVIKQSDPWWIGWIEEVPGVNCQERTRAELLETIEVTLREGPGAQPPRGARRRGPGLKGS
jgi:hypothetical protein